MKIMKKNILTLLVLGLGLCSCSESDLLKPFGPNDTTPPGDVLEVAYTATPGGAEITYALPNDEDVSYVKAVYNVAGVEKNTMSSQYKSNLTIAGLPEIADYDVTLYVYDKSGNHSNGVSLVITPEESPVNVMRNSLKVRADFGGFVVDYENPSRAELSMYLYQRDTLTKEMKFYEARVFSQAKGSHQFVGLPNITNDFQIFIRDQYENTSEPLEFTDRPWREEYMDKKLFQYVGEPAVYDKDDWWAWMGRPTNLWDDIVGPWNFAQTDPGQDYPHYFCIDMGKTVPIGRILIQLRLGDSEIFTANCIKQFDVYGCDKLPKVNREDPLEGWTKLNDEIMEVKRPSGRQPGEPPTTEDQEAAEKGLMFTIDTPFPRPEVRYVRFVFRNSFGHTRMALISEISLWAQWK